MGVAKLSFVAGIALFVAGAGGLSMDGKRA